MNFIKLSFCFLIISLKIVAQPYFQWSDSIKVKINNSYIANPWAGGLNFVQVSNIDLNQDGIKDLFVFDRTGNKIRTFINKGTANTVDLKYAPQYETKFPALTDWALLADYNCDGKEDIFSFSKFQGGFDVYKNVSTVANGIEFQPVVTQQRSQYNPPSGSLINLYVSPVDIPAITDVDNDGDLDVVTFAITGSYIEYHKNMSMELYGTCDSLKFKMANRCWGYAAENPMTNNFTLHDTCSGNVPNPELQVNESNLRSVGRHSGSCELCIDLDGDGDKEFIVGDISYSNLTMLTNSGSPTGSSFSVVDTAFPSNNVNTAGVDLTLFPCAFYADVNYDGKNDLIVSPSAANASENFNSVIYYKNTGTNSFPVFQFQQSNLLQDNMIEVGEGAYPTLFDYDNDGLKDLFIGNNGYFNNSGSQYQIAQFKNTGTATNPEFELITRDYAALSSLGTGNMVPAFGDMDGDGDSDMIIGASDGKLHYFQNNPNSGVANFTLAQPGLKNSNNRTIDVGDFAAPQIVDVDTDGKNDIIIGGRNGKIAYYHNIGTSSIPALDSVSHFWGSVKVNLPGYISGYSHPFLFKQNGKSMLLVGAESGYLNLYDSIDGNFSGTFNRLDSTYLGIFQGTHIAPYGTDINNDGDMDLFTGNYQGGISFYKGVEDITTTNDYDNYIHFRFELFPNPANNSVTIKVYDDRNVSHMLELYNIMGQFITSQKVTNNTVSLDTQNLKQGVYICKVSEINNNGVKKRSGLIKRLVVQH